MDIREVVGKEVMAQTPENIGGRCRARTCDPLLVSPILCFSKTSLFSTAYGSRSCPQPVETYGNDLRLSAFGSYDFDYIKMR